MLDVGTGSGILSIYGALLGANRILAIDIDSDALSWAERNIMLNEVPGSIELSSVPFEDIRESFFLVTANLILEEILKLLPNAPSSIEPGGWIILSGILGDQVSLVRERLGGVYLVEHDIFYQQEWACIVAKRSSC